jgi:hypothetical protein
MEVNCYNLNLKQFFNIENVKIGFRNELQMTNAQTAWKIKFSIFITSHIKFGMIKSYYKE